MGWRNNRSQIMISIHEFLRRASRMIERDKGSEMMLAICDLPFRRGSVVGETIGGKGDRK
jgi:hypothetical protein